MYRRVVFPLLKRMDAERAHDRTLSALEFAQGSAAGRLLLRLMVGRVPKRPVRLLGLTFPNELGVAAGFDKDVRVARGLAGLGFGHIETGTLTPRPQAGNEKPRLFRLPADKALINRMGFPNQGVGSAVPRLKMLSTAGISAVIGVSLGKQKETPLADAIGDYTAVLRAVYPHAGYVAINVSSPNTPGLRELQRAQYLRQLLRALSEENAHLATSGRMEKRPLLLKIAPDLDWPQLDVLLDVACGEDVAGIIAVNTTVERGGLTHPLNEQAGGLSGAPLRDRSDEIIAHIVRQTDGRLPVIGVGGVRSADDVRAKLDAGASLVQLYTGLVYEGPTVAGRILRALS